MALSLQIDTQLKDKLSSDILNRVTEYSAPAYFISSLYQNSGDEAVRARTLLNKVASFENAGPRDLDLMIRHALKVAVE